MYTVNLEVNQVIVFFCSFFLGSSLLLLQHSLKGFFSHVEDTLTIRASRQTSSKASFQVRAEGSAQIKLQHNTKRKMEGGEASTLTYPGCGLSQNGSPTLLDPHVPHLNVWTTSQFSARVEKLMSTYPVREGLPQPHVDSESEAQC